MKFMQKLRQEDLNILLVNVINYRALYDL